MPTIEITKENLPGTIEAGGIVATSGVITSSAPEATNALGYPEARQRVDVR